MKKIKQYKTTTLDFLIATGSTGEENKKKVAENKNKQKTNFSGKNGEKGVFKK